MLIPNNHPYWHVQAVVKNRDDIKWVPFSYYAYTPQTVADYRKEFLVSAENFLNEEYVKYFIDNVPADHELAVHSDFRLVGGGVAHLVMVDMSTAARAHLEKLRKYLGDNLFQQISWFVSGRSFHGYGEDLLSGDDWVRFMGLLLLANQPRFEPMVDPRWIGHRLLAGYSALRWTKNTSNYLVTPEIIDSNLRSKDLIMEQMEKKFRFKKII